MCRIKQLKPNNINIKINDQKPQDKKTKISAFRFRINQEIKFLHRKEQHLNRRLYYLHLEGAHQYNSMWQHIQEYIDEQISRLMDNLYQKLNKKSIFKSFNVNNLSVRIGWCADHVFMCFIWQHCLVPKITYCLW